jgi:phosphatidylglycerophosphatase A
MATEGLVQYREKIFKIQKSTPLMDNIYFPVLMNFPITIHFDIHTGTYFIHRTIAYVGISDFWGNEPGCLYEEAIPNVRASIS